MFFYKIHVVCRVDMYVCIYHYYSKRKVSSIHPPTLFKEEKVRITPPLFPQLSRSTELAPKPQNRTFDTQSIETGQITLLGSIRSGSGPMWHTCGANVAIQSEKKTIGLLFMYSYLTPLSVFSLLLAGRAGIGGRAATADTTHE